MCVNHLLQGQAQCRHSVGTHIILSIQPFPKDISSCLYDHLKGCLLIFLVPFLYERVLTSFLIPLHVLGLGPFVLKQQLYSWGCVMVGTV